MKNFNMKLFSYIICTILGLAGITLTADSNTLINLPKDCNIVGSVNLQAIKTIKSVDEAINQTQNDPVYQRLKTSGLSVDNINNIYFGMFLNKEDQKKPSFIALLETENPCDIKKFVDETPKDDKSFKITIEQYKGKDVYKFVSLQDTKKDNPVEEPVYCISISSTLVALGTKDYIHKSIDIANNKDNSILSNNEIIQLVGNDERTDMIWLASIVPEDFMNQPTANNANAAKSKIPNIKNGILALNYKEKAITLTGKINCKTPQDVQKIMLPVQMFLGIFAMNPDSGIDPQDIILKPNGTELNINITVPEKAIENLVNSQTKKAQQGQSVPKTNTPVNTPST